MPVEERALTSGVLGRSKGEVIGDEWKNHESETTEAEARGGTTRSSCEIPDKGMERRGCVMEPNSMSPPVMGGADE